MLMQLYGRSSGSFISSTSTTTSTTDNVRDEVSRQLAQAAPQDMADRRRALDHCGLLIGVAIEEARTWWQQPFHAHAFNAATIDANVLAAVSSKAAFASLGVSTSIPSPNVSC